MKKIAILGSTGSIGTQTLEVVRAFDDIQVCGLSGNMNIDRMEEQIREFKPSLVAIWDEEKAKELKLRVSDVAVQIVSSLDGLIQVATMEDIDILVTAIVGMIGLRATIAAIEAGKDIALANKETLVTAGHIIMPLAREKGVRILPVDSEHSAIFQCLQGNVTNREIEKILLTASGGPFRGYTLKELEEVTLSDALKHPNWEMGKKITIDSSTLTNKGLELIEAKWLFDVEVDRIQVIVQPGSIIHSMVAFRDGGVLAQAGTPDMKLPIQYALYYPERRFLGGERLDFWKLGKIDFEKPDMETFQALSLAYEAGRVGGSMPTAYNAANEWAVAAFIRGEIKYLDIVDSIRYSMEEHRNISNPSLEEILAVEKEVYDRLYSRRN